MRRCSWSRSRGFIKRRACRRRCVLVIVTILTFSLGELAARTLGASVRTSQRLLRGALNPLPLAREGAGRDQKPAG